MARELQPMREKDKFIVRVYGLSKVHKTGIPHRPIVVFNTTPTIRLRGWQKPLNGTETSLSIVKVANGKE